MQDIVLYDKQIIGFLEELWGDGFLSPGGPDEVALVINKIDIAGKHVLDIGSGSGACAVLLVSKHRAARVTGIDVEDPVCKAANLRAKEAGVEDRVEILKINPGPFPFDASNFDIVFSKDSIIHLQDKAEMARQAFRVLKPGGHFAASGMLVAGVDHYLENEDSLSWPDALNVHMTTLSIEQWKTAMFDAGFVDVEIHQVGQKEGFIGTLVLLGTKK